MSIHIGKLPNYLVLRELKTKTEIVIFNDSYSIKVNELIELLKLKKRETNKEIFVIGESKKKNNKYPKVILSTRDYKEVKKFLLELDMNNELEPKMFLRNKKLVEILNREV